MSEKVLAVRWALVQPNGDIHNVLCKTKGGAVSLATGGLQHDTKAWKAAQKKKFRAVRVKIVEVES